MLQAQTLLNQYKPMALASSVLSDSASIYSYQEEHFAGNH